MRNAIWKTIKATMPRNPCYLPNKELSSLKTVNLSARQALWPFATKLCFGIRSIPKNRWNWEIGKIWKIKLKSSFFMWNINLFNIPQHSSCYSLVNSQKMLIRLALMNIFDGKIPTNIWLTLGTFCIKCVRPCEKPNQMKKKKTQNYLLKWDEFFWFPIPSQTSKKK